MQNFAEPTNNTLRARISALLDQGYSLDNLASLVAQKPENRDGWISVLRNHHGKMYNFGKSQAERILKALEVL